MRGGGATPGEAGAEGGFTTSCTGGIGAAVAVAGAGAGVGGAPEEMLFER